MPELKRLAMTRIVALAEALDSADFAGALVFRVARDEAFVYGQCDELNLDDTHAIITQEASLVGAYLSSQEAERFLEHECLWELPKTRPAFAQGAVAHMPLKLYFEAERVLIMTPAPYASSLEALLEGYLS